MTRAGRETEMDAASEPGLALQGAVPIRHTILLVEDEDFVRNVTREVLRFSGYEVLAAQNAAQAKRIFVEAKGGVALLLTDVVLPGRTGHQLAMELRALQSTLRVILMSGYPQGQLAAGSPENGVLYLEKPFSVETLLQKVRHALQEEEWIASRENLAAGATAGT